MAKNVIRLANGLSEPEDAWVTECLVDRNGTRAYMRVHPKAAENTARQRAHEYYQNPVVRAELEKRYELAAAAAGCTRQGIIKQLYDLTEIDISEFFHPTGGIKAPKDWPKNGRKLVQEYNAGTVTAAEKIKFNSIMDSLFKLLEAVTPPGQRKSDVRVDVNMNVDYESVIEKLRLRGPGRVIDATPTG